MPTFPVQDRFDSAFAEGNDAAYHGLPSDVGFGMQFGDGVNVLSAANLQVKLRAPWSGKITRIILDADANCSATVNVSKNGTTIFGGGSTEPTLSGTSTDDKTSMTGITTTLAAGDAILFNLDTVSGGPKRLSVTIFVKRSP